MVSWLAVIAPLPLVHAMRRREGSITIDRDRFLKGRSPVHESMRRLARDWIGLVLLMPSRAVWLCGPTGTNGAQLKDGVFRIDRDTLLAFKLAARRFQDLADVGGLIFEHSLDASCAEHQHPSLRDDYLGCAAEVHRQREFEARKW